MGVEEGGLARRRRLDGRHGRARLGGRTVRGCKSRLHLGREEFVDVVRRVLSAQPLRG